MPAIRQKGLDIEGFKRGDMSILGEAVDDCSALVWRIGRAGFLTQEDGTTVHVVGVESADTLEHLVAQLIARVLTPAERSKITDAAALTKAVLREAKSGLLNYANRTGRAISIADEQDRAQLPAHIENLDAIMESNGAPSSQEIAPSAGQLQQHERAAVVCKETVSRLDERGKDLIRMRFVEGLDTKAVADAFDCGPAAVRAHERRLRYKLKRALRLAFPYERFGDATLDALLSAAQPRTLPSTITFERVKKDVLKRTFQEEPKPYGVRLAWGLSAMAFAMGLWTLMFLGVLPYYDDDPYPTPRISVRCAAGCKAGAEAKISVLAPRDTNKVAIALKVADKKPKSLLVNPAGRSIALPLGARDKLLPLPYTSKLPSDLQTGVQAHAVAVFSDQRLSEKQILDTVSGRTSIAGVSTTSIAIALVP